MASTVSASQVATDLLVIRGATERLLAAVAMARQDGATDAQLAAAVGVSRRTLELLERDQ